MEKYGFAYWILDGCAYWVMDGFAYWVLDIGRPSGYRVSDIGYGREARVA